MHRPKLSRQHSNWPQAHPVHRPTLRQKCSKRCCIQFCDQPKRPHMAQLPLKPATRPQHPIQGRTCFMRRSCCWQDASAQHSVLGMGSGQARHLRGHTPASRRGAMWPSRHREQKAWPQEGSCTCATQAWRVGHCYGWLYRVDPEPHGLDAVSTGRWRLMPVPQRSCGMSRPCLSRGCCLTGHAGWTLGSLSGSS